MQTIKIAIIGAMGRMGVSFLELLSRDYKNNEKKWELIAAVEWDKHKDLGKKISQISGLLLPDILLSCDKEKAIKEADLIIEYSSPESSLETAKLCAKYSSSLVLGTTGLNEKEKEELFALTSNFALMWAPNTSIGMNLLFSLTRKAAEILGDDYDIEIIEAHHNQKKDAPSGTAQRLKEEVLAGIGVGEENVVYGRKGLIGKRKEKEVGVHALRGGNIIGEHTVLFAGDTEKIELRHVAFSRQVFASGALKAGRKLLIDKEAKPGRYTMEDLFFKLS